MQRRHWALSALSALSAVSAVSVASALGVSVLAGCGDGTGKSAAPAVPAPLPPLKNSFSQTNLVANKISYGAKFTDADFVNAWGIAIRPAGAGGHFWVGAGGFSWQYLGDVSRSLDPALRSLSQDALKLVSLPGADSKTDETSAGKVTGVVFNGAPLAANPIAATAFRVTTQTAGTTRFDGSARFIFVTDSGIVSAWTDRATDASTVRRDGPAAKVFDGAAQGMAFFGCAIKTDTWDKLWLADFGREPQIRTLNAQWQEEPTAGFANPFATGPNGKPSPGDPVPFNIQVVSSRVFVTFAISQKSPDDDAAFYAAEEDALDASAERASGNKPNRGKLVEYTQQGALVRVFDDAKALNAPWGVAIAPPGFGKLAGNLLVGNFGGAGRISAFNAATGAYIDDLRAPDAKAVGIAGLWALQFGNGEALGDADALYFAAGPEDEADGLFGALRYAA